MVLLAFLSLLDLAVGDYRMANLESNPAVIGVGILATQTLDPTDPTDPTDPLDFSC